MKTVKNNKLIMKFLGAKTVPEDSLNPLILKWSCPKFLLAHNKFLSQNELKFDSDWNWLMPVLEKIQSLGYSINRSSSMVYINGDNGIVVPPINVYIESGTSEKKAVYDVCLSFIKWYNKQS